MATRIQPSNAFYYKYLLPNKNVSLVILFLIIFALVGYGIYYIYSTRSQDAQTGNIANGGARKNGFSGSGASGSSAPGTVEILFFNVDWCPHCVKAKPEWEKFCDTYDGQTVNGKYTVSCRGGKKGINCTNTDDAKVNAMIQQYSIEGYPTLKAIQDGNQVVDFQSKITFSNMEQFIQTMK